MNSLTEHMHNETHYVATQRVIERMISSPRDAADLLELYGGPQYDPAEYASNNLPSPEAFVATINLDSARVHAICSLNMFSSGAQEDSSTQTPNYTIALHIFPAYFNHSCIPNGTRQLLGDFLYIRAVRAIEKGEEVTLSYVNQGAAGYEQRKQSLEEYFIRCDCPMCDQDRSDGEIKRQEREDIVKKVQAPNLGIEELRSLLKTINLTYTTGHGPFRPAASSVHKALAEALHREAFHLLDSGLETIRVSSLLKEYATEQFSTLETLGLRILDKSVENIPLSKRKTLPISQDCIPYGVDDWIPVCLTLVAELLSRREFAGAERWMRAAIWSKLYRLIH